MPEFSSVWTRAQTCGTVAGICTAAALAVIAPPSATMVVPAMVADLGEAAALRFIDFFTANIRNSNKRAAYAVAVRSFFRWLEARGIRELGAVRTHHISAYVEVLSRSYKPPTVKQHLASIRMLFDWLIVGQVVGQNPAAAVRGPKHVIKKGKTPVLDGDEARRLLDSIDTGTVVGLPDRALIALLIYTFARVSAGAYSGWLRREKQLELLVSAVRGNANAAIVLLDFVLSLKGAPSHGRQQPVGSRWCHRIAERYTPPEWKFAYV